MYMRTKDSLSEIKKIAVPILRKNNVVRAGILNVSSKASSASEMIFGSFARGEAKKGSDIDILIEVKAKKFSLLDLVGVELELKKSLRKDVDLLTYKGIDPLLKDRIMKEEIRII